MLCYELLVGRTPFRATDPSALRAVPPATADEPGGGAKGSCATAPSATRVYERIIAHADGAGAPGGGVAFAPGLRVSAAAQALVRALVAPEPCDRPSWDEVAAHRWLAEQRALEPARVELLTAARDPAASSAPR